jgi:general secretion pathway protein H
MNRYRARCDTSSAPPRDRVSRAAKTRGFTLIEILIVVTLIAALTVILIGAMNGGMDGLKLRSNAKKLVAELRHARA